MNRTFAFLSSVGFGVLMSIIGVSIAFNTLSTDESKLTDVFLWNFYLAGFLAEKGLLPICANCELLTLMQAAFYGFIIGLIGYSAAFAGFLWAFNKFRSKKTAMIE